MGAATQVVYVSHVDWIGGAERSLLDLLAVLPRAEVAPAVLLPGAPGGGELARELERLGVPVHAVGELGLLRRPVGSARRLGDVGRLARGARAVLAALRALGPALVHANSTTAALFATHGARRLSLPLVWTLRDLTALGPRPPHHWLGRALARRCSRLIATSLAVEALAREVAGPARADRVVRIPSGIDTAHVSSCAPSAELYPPGGGPRILALGHLVPWKRHDLVVACAGLLRELVPGARTLVLGDRPPGATGPSLAEWRADVSSRGLAERVRFAGAVRDAAPALAAADVLLHAAYPEPYGRAVAEALAAGVPVVAFGGEHGPGELVRDGVDGLLVSERSARALADAVGRLAAQPELLRRLRGRGRERAGELDREHSARLHVELYREVLGDT